MIKCPVCGSDSIDSVFNFRLDELKPQDFKRYRLRVCSKCGLGFLNPQPSREFLSQVEYNEDYAPYQNKWRRRRRSLLQRAYRTVFPHPFWELFPESPGKALDAGCGNGFWVRQLSALGWEVLGLDIDEGCIANIRSMGFTGIKGAIEEANLPKSEFDLVLLSAVLEHTHDPSAAIKKVYSVLKPGGSVIIDVPNFGSVEVELFRKNWALFGVGHLFYFTQLALDRLLVSNNFEPEVFIRKSAEMTLGNSIARVFRISPGVPTILMGAPAQLLLNIIGRSGDLFCKARKPGVNV